jgi:hypothetical protein
MGICVGPWWLVGIIGEEYGGGLYSCGMLFPCRVVAQSLTTTALLFPSAHSANGTSLRARLSDSLCCLQLRFSCLILSINAQSKQRHILPQTPRCTAKPLDFQNSANSFSVPLCHPYPQWPCLPFLTAHPSHQALKPLYLCGHLILPATALTPNPKCAKFYF